MTHGSAVNRRRASFRLRSRSSWRAGNRGRSALPLRASPAHHGPGAHAAGRLDPLRDERDPLVSSAVVTRLFGSLLGNIDFVASNVPGLPVLMCLAGAELTGLGPLETAAAEEVGG